MKRNHLFGALAAAACFLCVPALLEARPQISEYTLRVHIYGTNWNRNSSGYHAFGRANLFDEQGVPHGVEFTYDCQDHLMASTATEAYPARWKKPGKRLEVLMPSDDIPEGGRPLRPVRCSLDVTLHDFVYLLLPNGKLVEVSKDVYQARPALRLFLRGHQETVQQRAEQFTVPVTALPKK